MREDHLRQRTGKAYDCDYMIHKHTPHFRTSRETTRKLISSRKVGQEKTLGQEKVILFSKSSSRVSNQIDEHQNEQNSGDIEDIFQKFWDIGD